ncbi:putative thioredoxin [Trypanosoma theileri]|uniref:Putative thioredoxin n=1 Tax=Trypanosoma theileri TaxID=67003 RepID=A0A1X0PAY2_9TRYP|nr:putative thioredoxin [Trypanosoma theileri]ORC93610.1 putative thioredoxin [Trypanosoma theileri]
MLLSIFLLLLFTSSGTTNAFPFSKSSGVTELTPATFNQFVSTHKPVYILFYAPWCGHCRKIHPEWEKFAQATQGTIRVGALNADEHSQLGQQFGIRGFPTIKYWNVGEKKIYKASEYDGPRQASAIQNRAMSLITSAGIKTILNSDALREAVRAAPEKKVVVLFSSKTRIPPIFSVLSHSPRLKSMPFYFVGGQAKSTLAAEFGVHQLPTIAVLNATEENINTVVYKGKQIAYEPIAKFLLACATNTLDELETEGTASGGEDNEGKNNEKTSNVNDNGNNNNNNNGDTNSRLAMPVRPVRLTTQLLENFCSPKMHRNGEKAPLCVVSLTNAFKLDSVHELFRNEPLLFFEAHEDRDVLLTALRESFELSDVVDKLKSENTHNVLLLRAPKRDTIRYKVLEDVKSSDDLNTFLQKAMSGELQLEKKTVS